MSGEKVFVSWSSGKDSALALHDLLGDTAFEVAGLLTIIGRDDDSVGMHGVKSSLVEDQASSLGLPLEKVFLPAGGGADGYDDAMREVLRKMSSEGVTGIAFGDIFLEDLRRYREERLSEMNMRAVFPLWGQSTTDLSRRFINAGFTAVITCVDLRSVPSRFAGADYDEDFLQALSPDTDPCGENGEFHTFVYGGPIFKKAVPFIRGMRKMSGDHYCQVDLVAHRCPLSNKDMAQGDT